MNGANNALSRKANKILSEKKLSFSSILARNFIVGIVHAFLTGLFRVFDVDPPTFYENSPYMMQK